MKFFEIAKITNSFHFNGGTNMDSIIYKSKITKNVKKALANKSAAIIQVKQHDIAPSNVPKASNHKIK